MSFIIIEGERYVLSIGETILGGAADELLATSPLASRPPFAVVSASPEGVATIHRYPGGPSSFLDGHPLTEQPVELEHGARIEMPGTRVVYGHLHASGKTAPGAESPDPPPDDAISEVVEQPTANSGGRLMNVADGTVHLVGEEGLNIGRDPACDIVIDSAKMSRNHARLEPTLLGYSLTDTSTNGVLVNGKRVEGSHRLNQGDLIRLADVEFRFEADAASFEPVGDARPAALVPPLAPPPEPKAPENAARTPRRGRQTEEVTPLLATIEVLTEGALRGKRFRIERPVAHIGRGDYNDVELSEESVSASHAMLMRRDDTWSITDLGSRNGTYVNGERITEGALDAAAEIRLGNVRVTFRPIAADVKTSDSTLGIVGISNDDRASRKPPSKPNRKRR